MAHRSLAAVTLSLSGMAPHTVASQNAPCSLRLSSSHRELVAESASSSTSQEGGGEQPDEIWSQNWKGGKYRRLAASRGLPKAIQMLLGKGLQRRNLGRGFGLQLFPGWVGRSPSPTHRGPNLLAGKGNRLELRKGLMQVNLACVLQCRWALGQAPPSKFSSAWGSSWGKHLCPHLTLLGPRPQLALVHNPMLPRFEESSQSWETSQLLSHRPGTPRD